MNKRQKEVIEHQLTMEKAVLDALEKEYEAALKDIRLKIKILQSDELTQSRIYHIQYQKTLEKQVEAALEKLHSDEYSTIQEYLSNSYTDAFVGTMYDVHGQGVPVIAPIDQNAAIKAVLTDSKLSKPLYDALGVDVNKLKKNISHEISRGIASGLLYDEIARNIQFHTNAPISRAKTIVRTEGHRIQEASAEDARQQAKAKGADVVKQWDATLDGETRPTHRELDGQIQEVDKPFEANGKKAMYPGEFGDPAEDCNCRCVALTRARWALDEDELETLKERAKFFDLDKRESFEDFKKKYLKGAEDVVYLDNPFVIEKELPPHIAEYQDYNDYRAAVDKYIKEHGSIQRYYSDSEWQLGYGLTEKQKDNIKRLDLTIEKLVEEYPLHEKAGDHLIIGDMNSVKYRLADEQQARITGDAQAQAWSVPDKNITVIGFEKSGYNGTLIDDLKIRSDALKAGKPLRTVLDASSEGTAIHEYGHLMSDYIHDGYIRSDETTLEYWDWYQSLTKKEIKEGVSSYAATNRYEFEAECFAELMTGNPRPIAKKYGKYLEKISGGKLDFSKTSGAKTAETLENTGKSGIMKLDLQMFAEKDLSKQKTSSLKKGLASFKEQITEHQIKIAEPQKYVSGWDSKDAREQQGLLKHWRKEISNFQESIDNRIDELKKRGEYDE